MRKDKFITTISNVATFLEVVNFIRKAPDYSPKIGVITAPYGIGKTETCTWYFTQNLKNTIYISITASMNTKDIFEEILFELGEAPKGNLNRIFKRIVDLINLREEPPLILLDESNRLANKERAVEMLRDVHDLTGSPICLVGSPEFLPTIRKYHAFYSRVRIERVLKPLNLKDVKKLAKELVETVSLTDDAVVVLKEKTNGNTRRIVITLGAVEEYARANQKEVIDASDLKKIFALRKGLEE